MNRNPHSVSHFSFSLPHLGQRIVKTGVAVFLCLLIYYLRGYRGQDMPTEAAITAIVCMQPYVRDTRTYALNRMAGTLIGAFWGLALLFLLLLFPSLGQRMPLIHAFMAVGVMLSLYSAVLIRKPDASGLAAIVFLCVVISFPEIESPLQNTILRISGVILGTLIAIAVNVFRLPRSRRRDRVFFVRAGDLVPDRFSRISPAVLLRMNFLYEDGAKVCMISEHAPAFLILRMHDLLLSVPQIVMDGAAIYDTASNEYLYAETIGEQLAGELREELARRGISSFIYTIHHNKTCIFHAGAFTPEEELLFNRLRRSPYRHYLDGEIYREAEIVYFKIIAEDERIGEIQRELAGFLAEKPLRAAVRAQTAAEGISGLYLYSLKATPAHAEAEVMRILREKDPALTGEEIFSPRPYRTEHDAMRLLHRLGEAYEPLRLPWKHNTESEPRDGSL